MRGCRVLLLGTGQGNYGLLQATPTTVLSRSGVNTEASACVEPGVKIVRGLTAPVVTTDGLRCVPPLPCTDHVDGIIWAPEQTDIWSTPQKHDARQVWFASSWEADSVFWRRAIGDAAWMTHMNYGRMYGGGTGVFGACLPLDRPPVWKNVAPEVFAQKTHGIVYVSSNCVTESRRDSFVWVASRYMDIESVGDCGHNRDWPQRMRSLEYDASGKKLRAEWKNYGPSTTALLEAYHFRLLIINTLCKEYFAEKIMQTLAACTIPIYLGVPNSHDYDPGIAAGVHPAMIHIQDFSSLRDLAQRVAELGADTEAARQARLRFFEFTKTPPRIYPRHRAKLIQDAYGATTWEGFVCERTHNGDPARHAGP